MAGRSGRNLRRKEADFILLFTAMTLLAIGIVGL